MQKGFLRDCQGAISVYIAMFTAVAIGGGALAIDFGRVALVGAQMQSAADAAALAAVIHLDGKDQSRARAEQVARNAADNHSALLPGGASGSQLEIDTVNFYSAYKPVKVAATSDLDAKIIEVTLKTKTVNYMFAPVLNLVAGGGEPDQQVAAKAVAGTRPFICHAPPMMMCDLAEFAAADDPTLPANVGKEVRLKEAQGGNGTWVPGNFGLLALPDGSSGAQDIEQALASVEPADCYQLDVLTATGSKTAKVMDGINTRFDISAMSQITYPPAEDVINYPNDDVLIADENRRLGDGVWDIAGYWAAKHGGAPPPELAGASRYQAYLYELGQTFARNGKLTQYPIPPEGPLAGYTPIIPPGPSVPVDAANPTDPDFDGVPQNPPAPNGPARRLMKVAILQCIADGITGSGTYPTHGKFVELFITKQVENAPEAAIFGEIVRSISPINEPQFHANAALIE